ncbi:MAG: hypothetical protein ACI9TK_000626 [Flavobacteriaceae bacterium]|jgi:hypothetical protein
MIFINLFLWSLIKEKQVLPKFENISIKNETQTPYFNSLFTSKYFY